MHESKFQFRGKTLKLQLSGNGLVSVVLAFVILVVPYVLTATIIVSVALNFILKKRGQRGIFQKNGSEFIVRLHKSAWEKKI
jgi:hypothetical protein